MRGVVLVVVAFAACDNATAIEVVVPEGMAAHEVDLYIPLDGCRQDSSGPGSGSCDGLIGDNGVIVGSTDGTVDSTDRILELDTMLHQPADGPGTYEFRLEPGERDTIELLIAVARDANGDPTGAVVFQSFNLDDGPARRAATLGAAPDLQAMPAPSNATGIPDFVHVWDAPPDIRDSHCVEVKKGTSIIAIVDGDDPDCDGFVKTDDNTNLECVPLEWNSGFANDPTAPATCSVFDADARGCFLGNDGCEDGVGRMGACTPKDICVSADICSDCATDTQVCYFGARRDPNRNIAHLDCTVRVKSDAQQNLIGCDSATNVESFVPVKLGGLFAATACDLVRFAPQEAPESIDTQSYVVDSLGLPALAAADTFAFTVKHEVQGNCSFGLAWIGPAPQMPLGTQLDSTMLIDVTDPNGLVLNQMLLPVHITFTFCETGIEPGACVLAGAPESLMSLGACAP